MPDIILLVGAPSHKVVKNECSSVLLRETAKTASAGQQSFCTAPTEILCDGSSTEKCTSSDVVPETEIDLPQDVQDLKAFQPDALISSDGVGPDWRVIKPQSAHIATGLTQKDWLMWTPLEWAQRSVVKDSFSKSSRKELESSTELDTSFATEFDQGSQETNQNQSEAAFLEQSFAIHEDAEGAPVTPAASLYNATASFEADLLSLSSSDDESQGPPSSPLAPKSARKGNIRPRSLRRSPNVRKMLTEPPLALDCLPSVDYIHRTNPSTITATLLVTVVKLGPPRPMTIKRTGGKVDLIEAVVMDDTGADGLGISFWLHDAGALGNGLKRKATTTASALRAELEKITIGDVVLMTNLALAEWGKRVYGTSLTRRNWRTSVELIWKRGMGWTSLGRRITRRTLSTANSVDESLSRRAENVKDWAEWYIVPASLHRTQRRLKRRSVDSDRSKSVTYMHSLPPDDTQV